jgi:hypothetical protein
MKDVKTNQRHLTRRTPGKKGIDEDELWARTYNTWLKQRAGDSELPVYQRLTYLAQAKCGSNNHAEFGPGELSNLLSVTRQAIYVAIDKAVKLKLLMPGSNLRCLRFPLVAGKGSSERQVKCQGRKIGVEISGDKTKDLEELFHRLLDNGKERSTVVMKKAREIASDWLIKQVKRKLKIRSFRQANGWFMALPTDLPKPKKRVVLPKKKKVTTGKPAKKPTNPSKQRKLVIVRSKPIKPVETKAAPKKYVLVRSPIVKARESPENSSRVMSLEYVDTDRLDELLLDLAGTKASKNGNSRGDETQTWFETEQQTKDRIRAENQLMFRNLN